MSQYLNQQKGILIALAIIMLYLSPLYLLGENAHVRIHDNIDSNIGWYKLLAQNGHIFGPLHLLVQNMMNGMPRVAFGSEFNLNLWLYAFFQPFTSYTINATLMRLAAFVGMYLLLKHHFIKKDNISSTGNRDREIIIIGTSLTFALLPYWPSGGLSIAGQPLILFAFLNIRAHKASYKDWLLLFLIPLYSNLIYVCFMLAVLGLLLLYDWVKTRKFNLNFMAGIAFMSLIYCLVDYRMIYSIIHPDFVNFRTEFNLGHTSLPGVFRLALKNFTVGHGHVATVHFFLVLPLTIAALAVAIIRREKAKLLISLLLIHGALSIWYAFWYWEGMRVIKDKFSIANTFNFSRFQFLHPVFWYVSFAVALMILLQRVKHGRKIALAALCLQVGILFCFNDEILYRTVGHPSYKQFYAEGLFKEIQHFIGRKQPDYRAVSIGLHPIIAQYNGFYTLDFYNNIYPLSYKHKFREIAAAEFEKNKKIRRYYDNWGARCYIFTAELKKKYMFTKKSKTQLHHLQLNSKALAQMGGEYVFSAVKINNNRENHLTFLKAFEHKDTPWRIYLYKVG
ncbi:MAG TPA: DUF6044 family protein [Bacilli bacterium]